MRGLKLIVEQATAWRRRGIVGSRLRALRLLELQLSLKDVLFEEADGGSVEGRCGRPRRGGLVRLG